MKNPEKQDYIYAEELRSMSGSHESSVYPGTYYVAKMAKIVARIRANEQRKIKKKNA